MRQQIAALQLEAGSFNKESRSVAERNTELTRQLQTKLAVLDTSPRRKSWAAVRGLGADRVPRLHETGRPPTLTG